MEQDVVGSIFENGLILVSQVLNWERTYYLCLAAASTFA